MKPVGTCSTIMKPASSSDTNKFVLICRNTMKPILTCRTTTLPFVTCSNTKIFVGIWSNTMKHDRERENGSERNSVKRENEKECVRESERVRKRVSEQDRCNVWGSGLFSPCYVFGPGTMSPPYQTYDSSLKYGIFVCLSLFLSPSNCLIFHCMVFFSFILIKYRHFLWVLIFYASTEQQT